MSHRTHHGHPNNEADAAAEEARAWGRWILALIGTLLFAAVLTALGYHGGSQP